MEEMTNGRDGDYLAEMDELHARVMGAGSLSKREKELIALALSVAMRCETSAAYHLYNALESGATPKDIDEALEIVVTTMGEPAAVQLAQVRRALEERPSGKKPESPYRRGVPYMSPD
jgi:AhpD family alkylhydroperoxidase